MKKFLVVVPFVLLAACDAPTGGAVSMQDGEIRGSYDPATTDREVMLAGLRNQCPSGNYNHFVEYPQSNGVISYVARCS